METTRSPMPPLAPSEGGRNRKEHETYHDRGASLASSTHSIPAAATHTASHGQGYSSPYSQGALSLTHLANAASKELGTPPDSRRASGEEKDSIVGQKTRQSLPSISEALGIDNSNNALHQPAMSQALQSGASITAASPAPTMRTYVAEPAQPHVESYASKYSAPYSSHSMPTMYEGSDAAAGKAPVSGLRPALHVHTPQAPSYAQGPSSQSYPISNPSPAHDRPPQPLAAPPQPANVPTTFPYGYTTYPPRYAQPGPAANAPVYHTAAAGGTRPAWEADSNSSLRYSAMEKTYGESVKRHLDLYDLESALNDISSASNFLGDFARRYGDLVHQSPRAGLSLSALPSIVEIEDMIAKSRTQTEALIKISETVLARQAAHDERKAELRHQGAYGEYDDSSIHDEDSKGPDAKKRRGRAAPPGRCHSCNRAETPEWRRGPDGARTLCNACGLHYAKLTRKANSAGKAPPISSSNLRPKENLS